MDTKVEDNKVDFCKMLYGISQAEADAHNALVAKLSKEMLGVCAGQSVRVVKSALEKATRDCERQSVVTQA